MSDQRLSDEQLRGFRDRFMGAVKVRSIIDEALARGVEIKELLDALEDFYGVLRSDYEEQRVWVGYGGKAGPKVEALLAKYGRAGPCGQEKRDHHGRDER